MEIKVLKGKMIEAKLDYSEQCYYKGAFYHKSGNMLDALLFMEKSIKVNSQSEKAKALRAIIKE